MAYTGLLLASLGSILILVIGWYILQVVAYWQIFEKAGEPGWKAIIPCYNTYTQYKFTWNANIYWFVLFGTVIGGMLKSFDGIFSVLGSAITGCHHHQHCRSEQAGQGFRPRHRLYHRTVLFKSDLQTDPWLWQ